MHISRLIYSKRGDNKNLGLHVIITQVVNTLGALCKIIDGRQVELVGGGGAGIGGGASS